MIRGFGYEKDKDVVFCISLFVALLLSSMEIHAEESDISFTNEQYSALYEILSYVEIQKYEIGLSGVDFNELCIGKPIQTYCYLENGFEELRNMYPLTYRGELVLWVIDAEGKYQVTTGLTREINEMVSIDTEFALIYDRSNSYIYSEGKFVLLGSFGDEVHTRAVLNSDNISNIELRTSALSDATDLNFENAKETRDAVYFSCNVGYISQKPYKNLCWAATIASITNYCTGTSFSMADIAANEFGYVKDESIDTAKANNILARYGVKYEYKNIPPSHNVILSNIQANYPIYGCFVQSGTRSGHAVVVYGINVVGDYLSLMDPANGFTSATHNGRQYLFVSASTGITYELYNANCHSW